MRGLIVKGGKRGCVLDVTSPLGELCAGDEDDEEHDDSSAFAGTGDGGVASSIASFGVLGPVVVSTQYQGTNKIARKKSHLNTSNIGCWTALSVVVTTEWPIVPVLKKKKNVGIDEQKSRHSYLGSRFQDVNEFIQFVNLCNAVLQRYCHLELLSSGYYRMTRSASK